MTSSYLGPDPAATAPAPAETAVPAPEPGAPGAGVPVAVARGGPAGEPMLSEQSREDTDAAWGEYPEPADDRLYRDRPPHWDDF